MSPLKLIKLKKGHRPQIKITTKLESFYSRIINQKVDLNEYKTKVNSDYKSVMGTLKVAKSLKQRVLDISKLNNQITKISSINKLNKGQITEIQSTNVKELKSDLNNISIAKKDQFLRNLAFKRQKQMSTKQNLTYLQRRFEKSIIGKYFHSISKFDQEIVQFQNIVYNFNNNNKNLKKDSILENLFLL